ncbi:MAG: hypothetical protein HY042_02645, partial [Spirochaetia bacterium]|nr:hypothetical protein [Spirochaetia bacterium]
TIIRRGDDTKIAPGAAGDFGRASNIKLHILADGDRYVLDQDRVIFNDRPLVAPPQTREQADDELAASRAAK